MSATVEIDDVRMRDALNRLVSLGLDTGRVLRVEGRKLLKEIIKRTPPDDRAQGENAIKEDIFGGRKVSLGRGNKVTTIGIFYIIGENPRATRKKGGDIMLFASKDGSEIFGTEANHYKPNATIQEMDEVHQAARSRATGRVSIAGSMTRTVGRWRFVDRMTVKRSTANRYFRHVKQRVGKMKGGWGMAAQAVGITLPSWVSRHATVSNGYVIDRLGNGDSPSLTVANTTNGVKTKTLSAVKRALHKTPPGSDPPENPVSYQHQPPPQNRILAVTERNRWRAVADWLTTR